MFLDTLITSPERQKIFIESHILFKENKLLFRLGDFPRAPNLKLLIDVLRLSVSLVLTRVLWAVPTSNIRKTIQKIHIKENDKKENDALLFFIVCCIDSQKSNRKQ